MAMRKIGARLITVDGVVYRWRVRRARRCSAPNKWGRVHLSVELADEPGSVLVVFTNHQHSRDEDRLPGEEVYPILPRHVAEWVRQARAIGWQPAERGPQFRVVTGVGSLELERDWLRRLNTPATRPAEPIAAADPAAEAVSRVDVPERPGR